MLRKYMCMTAVMACLIAAARVIGSEGGASAKDFGITANSPDDQTGQVQKYLDETAKRGGGDAYLPAGGYTIKGSLTIPKGVTLTGSWSEPHHSVLNKGTTINAYFGQGKETGPALLELREESGVRGLTIFYPEQKLENIQPYSWTIHGLGMHNSIENVTLVNSYQGISIGPESNELHLIRNVFGCVLRRGVKIDNTTDIGRIENVHFNPHYWGRIESKDLTMTVAQYMQENLEAFIFARTDWQEVSNCFVFGAKIGYEFITSENGGCNGQLSGIGADMSRCCVLVDKAQPCGISITNGMFVAGPLNPKQNHETIAIRTTPAFDSSLQLTNCNFWGFFTNVMKIEGSGFVSLNQATIQNWTPGNLAINIIGGRASVSNVLFKCKADHFHVGKDVKKVFISNNFAEGGVKIVNEAGERLSAKDNE